MIISILLSLSLSLAYEKETKIKKLGEVATFEYGYTATAADKGEFRYIRITDIDEYGNISEKDKKYVELSNETDEKKYLLKENDIVVARTGSVGKTAIFQSKEKSIFASYLIRINLNQKEIIPKYYWLFTKMQEYWWQVEKLIKGTAQLQFNANSLKEIKVAVPNLEEQKRIVSKWEERKKKIIANQKEAIKIFQEEEWEILNGLWKQN